MKLGKGLRIKAKDLRKKQPKELISMLSNIDMEIATFRGKAAIGEPLKDNVGVFQNLKRNKAVILTVLTEQRRIQKGGN